MLIPLLNSRVVWAEILVLVAILLALWKPLLGNSILSRVEHFGVRLAERKGLAIILVAVAMILLRLVFLGWIPVPFPRYHDGFGNLLAGDTFAHGRLTNPTHPMWIYFDTYHELQHPTYMSKYPPGQGAFLALGQIMGHPWIGVLLSTAAMCAAVVWALQGWFPARWALLGGILVLLRFGLFGYWVNSYFGGAVAALGGALVLGTVPRIMHHRRSRDAFILGIGVAILLNTRPVEGLFFCLPVVAVLLLWLLRRPSADRIRTFRSVVLPVCAVGLLCGVFDGYYNWRITGNPLLFPYVLHERTYSSLPAFQWQEAKTPLHYVNPQFEQFYNQPGVIRTSWEITKIRTFRQVFPALAFVFAAIILSYMYPALCVPIFAAIPWVLRDRRARLLLIQTAFCCAACVLVIWFQPHYVAPLTVTLFALIIQSMRHLRQWRLSGRPVGIGLSRVVVLLSGLVMPFLTFYANESPFMVRRAQVERQLEAKPGEHLVIVRYLPGHSVRNEWVFNRADIDHAKVVWAREIPGISLDPLLSYFHGRQVWLVEPDSGSPRPLPYGPGNASSTALNKLAP